LSSLGRRFASCSRNCLTRYALGSGNRLNKLLLLRESIICVDQSVPRNSQAGSGIRTCSSWLRTCFEKTIVARYSRCARRCICSSDFAVFADRQPLYLNLLRLQCSRICSFLAKSMARTVVVVERNSCDLTVPRLF
jgi:hypothetical protein